MWTVVMLRVLPAVVLAGLGLTGSVASQPRMLILSTTTSTQDSGLLDVLVPMFEQRAVR